MGTKQAILKALKGFEDKDPDTHFETILAQAIGIALGTECEESEDGSSQCVSHEGITDAAWEQDGKYQSSDCVFKITVGEPLEEPSDVFYVRCYQIRSGSYHTDWYYTSFCFSEVTPKEVTETITRTVWEKA